MRYRTEAETHLQEAFVTFAAMQARYELARIHLVLASLAPTQNNRDTAATHLRTAPAWFKRLPIPQSVTKTVQLAQGYDVTLPEATFEEVREDSS